MVVEVHVDAVALDGSAGVLGYVGVAADLDLGAVGDDTGINCDGGSSFGDCADGCVDDGVAMLVGGPVTGELAAADLAGAVGRQLIGAEAFPCLRGRLCGAVRRFCGRCDFF